jgi:hypothetical protein
VSFNNKRIWKKPDLRAFDNAKGAIAYYSARGKHEHAAAVERMVADIERDGGEADDHPLSGTPHR